MSKKLTLNLSMNGAGVAGKAALACYELSGANACRLQVPVCTIDSSGNPNTDCSYALTSAQNTWAMGGTVILFFDAGPAPGDANFTALYHLTGDVDYLSGNAAPNFSRPHTPIYGETGYTDANTTATRNAALWLKMGQCYEYAINLFVAACMAAGYDPTQRIQIEWWNEPNYVTLVPGTSAASGAWIGQTMFLGTALANGATTFTISNSVFAPYFNWVLADFNQNGRIANVCFGKPFASGSALVPLASTGVPGSSTINLATAYVGPTLPVGTPVAIVPVDENGKIATLDPLFRGMSNVIVPYLRNKFGAYTFHSHSIAGTPQPGYYDLTAGNNYLYADVTFCSEDMRLNSCAQQNDPFWQTFDVVNLHLYCANPVHDIATPLGGSAYANTLGGMSAVFNIWKARLEHCISVGKKYKPNQQFFIGEAGCDETNLGILTTNQVQAFGRNNDNTRGWLCAAMVHYMEANSAIMWGSLYQVIETGTSGQDQCWADSSGNVYQLFRAVCNFMVANGDSSKSASLFVGNIPSVFTYGGVFANSGNPWAGASTALTTAQKIPS